MKLFPSTLAGQFLFVTIGAIFLAQSIVFAGLFIETRDKLDAFEASYVDDPIVTVYRQTMSADDALRRRFFEVSSSLDTVFSITKNPLGEVPLPDDTSEFVQIADVLNAPVRVAEKDVSFRDTLLFWLSGEDENCFIKNEHFADSDDCPYWQVSLQYPDGLWMVAKGVPGPEAYLVLAPVFAFVFLTLIGITIVVALLTRRLTAPLRQLSQAVDDIGRGKPFSALPEIGPAELSSVMAAFNEMQERVNRYVHDRTTMLAAISHDLRTPITSLRLRAEFVDDEELREKVVETLDDMKTMVESFLTFSRQETSNEQQQEFDLVQICRSMADDTAGMQFHSKEDHCPFVGQKVNLKRALSNIVHNAIKYGKEARVSLRLQNNTITITVEDDGPGVPQDRLEEIFAPFVRLDSARSVEEGSVGLGLSITRSIIRKHGGDVFATNTASGLCMTVQLDQSTG